jgi:hypothetical protein
VVAALALWVALGGFRFRRRLLNLSSRELARDSSSLKALKHWEVGNVIELAMAEGVVLWGLVLRMVLGGALWQASFFYAVGLGLLLLWTPRIPTIQPSN